MYAHRNKYLIKEELGCDYSDKVNHGRLYPVLNQLAERGFVEKRSVDKRTNSHGLTECGHQAIETRREWETST